MRSACGRSFRPLVFVIAAELLTVRAARAQPTGVVEADTAKITPAMVNLGRAIFHGKGMCFACHGPSLEGSQLAPTLKAHAWRDAKNGDFAALVPVLMKGVPSTAMVSLPGGISPEEARSVASYIWSVNHRQVKP